MIFSFSIRPKRRGGTLLGLTVCGLACVLAPSSAYAATFDVTRGLNSGPGTLRQAILDANASPGADNIRIVGFAGVIPIDTELPTITDDVTIDGLDDGQTLLLQAIENFRIFTVSARNVTIANLEFESGVADNGGAISNGNGKLTLLNAQFRKNSATGATQSNGGGAVYSSGPVLARGCTFDNNNASVGAGSGGAILVAGASLELNNCVLQNNRSNFAGGAIETRGNTRVNITGGSFNRNATGVKGNGPGIGGALHISGPSAVLVAGTTFQRNTALFQGGALWNASGANMIVDGVSIDSNSLTDEFGPGNAGGGGVYNNGGNLTVRNSTLAGNDGGKDGTGGGIFSRGGTLSVTGGSMLSNFSFASGGAVKVVDGKAVLNGANIQRNTSFGDGGGLYASGSSQVSIVGGEITNNRGDHSGGGLWNGAGSTINVQNTTLNSNTAFGTDDASFGGGGIYNAGTLSLRGATMTGNTVSGRAGSGGAIFNRGGAASLTDSRFMENSALRAGGAIETLGGKIVCQGGLFASNVATGDVASKLPGAGGALHAAGAAAVFVAGGQMSQNSAGGAGGAGGALWNDATSVVRVDGTFFGFNSVNGTASAQGGGALYNAGGTLSVRNAQLTNNQATGAAGGAIYNNGGRLEFVNGMATGNTANLAGGAIESLGAATNTLIDVTLDNNIAGTDTATALGNGGALHINGAARTFVARGTFSNNTAANAGGALWNSRGATLVVDGTSFKSNHASGNNDKPGDGGAIYGDGGVLTIRNASFDRNSAFGVAGSGGAIYNNGGQLQVNKSSLTYNDARRAGGAIETAGIGGISVIDSQFGNNSAGQFGPNPGNGGAIHTSGADTVFIVGSTFENNSAFSQGGALWTQKNATLTAQDTTFRGNIVAGTIGNHTLATGGGGIYNNGGAVNLRKVTLDNNQVMGSSGTNGGSGGGIFNNGGTLSMTAGALTNNSSSSAGGGIETVGGKVSLVDVDLNYNLVNYDLGDGSGNGGALHISGAGNVLVTRGDIQSNRVAANGGGIWNSSEGKLVVDGTRLSLNVALGTGAQAGGGAIYNDGGSLTIRGATVELNSAQGDGPGQGGGGLWNRGNASIANTGFRGNTATNGQGNGGAILSSGSIVINESQFDSNKAASAGGGVENAGNITILRSTLSGNTAGVNGGGLHTSGAGRTFLIASTVSSNTAQQEGGGLWNSAGGMLAVSNSTLDNNRANGNASNAGGGALYNDGGMVALDSATLTFNHTNGTGGGLLSVGGTVNSLNSVIALNFAPLAPDVSGAFNSQGYNLLGVAPTIYVARSGDLSGTLANPLDPKLNPLSSNGGLTLTHLPRTGSPLIDAGDTSATTDQRGVARPQGARKDIGAVETSGSTTSSAQAALLLPSKAATAPSGGNS